jgi:cation diffusion facilitator CzcD-associated flavoprotein CzcO
MQLGTRKDLYDKLTPTYEFGCQRTAFAWDYYPVFTKPNTTLVTTKITSVEDGSIITEDGASYQIDVRNEE